MAFTLILQITTSRKSRYTLNLKQAKTQVCLRYVKNPCKK